MREALLRRAFRDAVTRGETQNDTALRALRAWGRVKNHMPGLLAVPNMSIGESGKILLFWESGSHYIELETLPDEPQVELFYRNRQTRDYYGEDWLSEKGTPLPDYFCEQFNQFRVVHKTKNGLLTSRKERTK